MNTNEYEPFTFPYPPNKKEEMELVEKRFIFDYTVKYKNKKYVIRTVKSWDNISCHTITDTIIFANRYGTEIVEDGSDLWWEILKEFNENDLGIDI